MPKLERILFIYPRFRRFYQVLAEWYPSFGKRDYDAYAASRTPPCLAFPILAALTPDHIQIDFLDDRIDELDMDNLDADLYCLHIKTEMAPRAYELADQLRAAGKTVILGGLHVTYRPEEDEGDETKQPWRRSERKRRQRDLVGKGSRRLCPISR